MSFVSLFLTLKLATYTTLLLLLIGAPFAWWLSRTKTKFKPVIEALTSLPLILPPTVLGFYLLVLLAPDHPVGKLLSSIGIPHLPFTFPGLVIGSMCYSFPFVVQPLHNAFRSIDNDLLDTAAVLGATPVDRFFSIALPLSRPGIITASVLGFAHTVGEFGVILMIGGNIPGKTQVISIAIYDHVENLEYSQAHLLSGILLVFSFLLLLSVYFFNRNADLVKLND
jgi:molybdate transport system permease protein